MRALAERGHFDGRTLTRAIKMTFEKRDVQIPTQPLALTSAFAEVEGKRDQWNGFLRKNGLSSVPFEDVIRDVSKFLLPVIAALVAGRDFEKGWPAGGPWN